ncbi:DoxX family protein [Streptomyces sp. NPDC057445]|uniref:DoxX family protein n=1 Tax=Streptomyces sp. NPDC057445 TaxID=3346136 RepID=UPI0036C4E001
MTATALSVVVGVLFVVTGGVKVVGLRQSLAIRDHFGMAPMTWRVIGVLESAGGVGVLLGIAFAPLGGLALAGLALLMVGAIVSRLKVRDPALMLLADALVLALVVATAAALLAER